MTNDKVLEAYLADTTLRFGDSEAFRIFMRFMCRCLMLARENLPLTGRDALDMAVKFWMDGEGLADDLLVHRVNCWKLLDGKGRSTDILDREDTMMRALICVLYAEPESYEDSTDSVRFFISMFDRFESYSVKVEQLMRVQEEG